MKKKDLITKEFNAWVKNLNPFPGFDDLYVMWYESSKYLKDVWNYFKEKFDELYKYLEDSPILVNDNDFSKENLMIEMFKPIEGNLTRNFYSIYKNYEERDEYIPWLDKNGNQIYDEEKKPMQLVRRVKIKNLEDYTITKQSVEQIINSYFSIPNLLVAILKNNRELLEREKMKARRRKVEDKQWEKYMTIIELYVTTEKYNKPNVKNIVRKVNKGEGYQRDPDLNDDELYYAYRQWKKNNSQLYQNICEEFRKKLNN